MNPEENQEAIIDAIGNEGEGEQGDDFVKVSKSEYEKMNQTLGSLKRELKDLRKPKEDVKETPKSNQPDNAFIERMEKIALRQAGISHPDDIELARKTAQKWNMDVEDVISDEDFMVKLERQQTSRSNVAATSKVRGGNGTTDTKSTVEYWKAKGVPPTPADIPDRKTRAAIVRQMVETGGSSKMFYNE